MDKQIKLYSINLGMAKTDYEKQLYQMKYINDRSLFRYKKYISKLIKEELKTDEWNDSCSELLKEKLRENQAYSKINEINKELNHVIKNTITIFDNERFIRKVDSRNFKETNVIAFFDNALTRTLDLNPGDITLDFIVIEVGNTDMMIVEQVISNGLTITERVKVGEDENGVDLIEVRDNKYKFFTAGAGQTRQKKFMMIKEEVWEKNQEKLMNGLTIDYVNLNGGMNVNKFNAYLSLNNSASEIVEGFDIDKCIVVEDFVEVINDEVDYITRDDNVSNGETNYTTKSGKNITRKKKKTDWNIERQFMDVPISFMDGAGICLHSIFRKNTQIRLPWFKGILCPVNYIKYIKDNKLNPIVRDIYGKEYDVIKDDIRVIFTKSQFKMWKYYKNIEDSDGNIFMTGWEVYKACYKFYENTCNKCMEDESKFKNMKINYQMLQTLTDMTDEQIEKLTSYTKQLVNEVHKDRKSQLDFLGATLENNNRNYMQEIIRLYPEILSSNYIKKQLKDTITSFKKEAKSGRIKLKAKRAFIIPDLVHFMSLLFGDGKDYALEKDEVNFKVYKKVERLALLRSPHLSREWAIKKNVINDKTKYFQTNGIYVNSKDLMSLVLMNDWDGDETLIVKDCEEQEWLLDLAEAQMRDLKPLYYEMGGGGNSEINNKNIYKSLKFVYQKSNIGKVSNTLTNIWAKENPDEYMDEIKKLCAYNNWIIDSAKKLELPKLPIGIKKLMNNDKYPHFFKYAKNKEDNVCRSISNGVIDRICKSIDNIEYKNFDYSKGFGKFRLNNLLNNKKIEVDKKVIEFYKNLEIGTRDIIKQYSIKYKKEECDFNYKELAYEEARVLTRDTAESLDMKYSDFVDMIVKYSFKEDENKLAFVFNVFGEEIIRNINKNLKMSMDDNMVGMCEECGKRFKLKTVGGNSKYCNDCAKEINRLETRERMRQLRQQRKMFEI